MATYNVNRSALDKVLSGTTADTVNIDADDSTGAERFVTVYNVSGSAPLYIALTGTAVASADGTIPVYPGMWETIELGQFGDKSISIVGNGNTYSVVGSG